MRCWLGWLVLNGHGTLDGIMFEIFFISPFVYGFMMAFAYVRPWLFDVVIMSVVVKGGVFEFIGRGGMENWMLMCESHQYWFYLVAIYKTLIPHINVMNNLQWEEIQRCVISVGDFLWGKWNLQGWAVGVAWWREDIVAYGSSYSWYSVAMLLWIYHISPTCFIINTIWQYKTRI